MFKKTLLICSALVLALSFAFAGTSNAMNKGPEEMVLKSADAKKPAFFPHAKHQEMKGVTCGTCHHTKDAAGKQVPYSEGMEIQKCETCHNKTDMKDPKLESFKGVAHERCKGCHAKKKAEGIEAPTKCNDCHRKDLK